MISLMGRSRSSFLRRQVIKTIENQGPIYTELMKRGQKLRSHPSAPAFLEKEMKRLEEAWKETNVKAKERLELLQSKFVLILLPWLLLS